MKKTGWIFLALFALVLSACAQRGMMTMPAAPSAADAAKASDFSNGEIGRPELVRSCRARKFQPRWIFLGACTVANVRRPGARLSLAEYEGYTLKVHVPRNDAAGLRLRLVNATGSDDIKPYRSKTFPPYKTAFLYVQFVSPSRAIIFAKSTRLAIALTTDGLLGDHCGVAALKIAKKSIWRVVSTVAEPSANRLSLAIPSADYPRIERGASYLALFCSQPPPVPTPTPTPVTTPTPTAPPTVAPTAAPTLSPSYCAPYKTPAPYSGGSNVEVDLTDQSGLGTGQMPYLFVVNGSVTQFLAPNGKMTMFAATPSPGSSPGPNATAAPLPIDCYPGSVGGSGQKFFLPGVFNGRLYVAYGPTPSASNPTPNPMGSALVAGNQPTVSQGASGYVTAPWDFVEITLPSGIVDTSQVNAVGLPLQVTIAGQGTVGVTGTGYQSLVTGFASLSSTSPYKNLLVTTTIGANTVAARVIAPGPNGISWGFPQDWFYNKSYNPESSGGNLGYLGYVLGQYKVDSFLYDLAGSPSSGVFCAGSDGSSVFTFTPVKSGPCPNAAVGSPVTVSIKTLEAAMTNSCNSTILTQPYGSANYTSPFSSKQAFFLWKAMTLDFNRGTMLSGGSHPVGGWQTGGTPQYKSYFGNNFYNVYSALVHANFINHQAYTLSYDEPGGMASTLNASGATPIQILVGKIPTVSPVPSPKPVATPSVCYGSPYLRLHRR